MEPSIDMSYHSRSLAYYLNGESEDDVDLYVMINEHDQSLRFSIVDGQHKPWFRVVDTGLDSPNDICESGTEIQVIGTKYLVQPRSIVVLIQ